MSEIYEPAEDSYLLANVLKKYLPILIEKNPMPSVGKFNFRISKLFH